MLRRAILFPPTRGDRAMMPQVFVNVLSNAIKFSRTRETPGITVGSSIDGSETVYYVKDNGVDFDMRSSDKPYGVFQSVGQFLRPCRSGLPVLTREDKCPYLSKIIFLVSLNPPASSR